MNKKKIIFIFVILFVIGIAVGVSFYFIHEDPSNLSLSEKKWIESNKNKMIDISIQSDVPLYNYNGEGVVLDFIEALEQNIGLEFNKITDSNDDQIYAFTLKEKKEKDDIVLLEDYDVLLTKVKKNYQDTSDFDEMTVGVVENNLDIVNQLLNNKKLSFKAFKSEKEILAELAKEKSSIQAGVVSKTQNLAQILKNNFSISYSIIDKKIYYVLDPSNNHKLNSIIKKYYEKWSIEDYEASFAKQFVSLYDEMKKIEDKEKSNLKSKNYVYGFIEDIPYNSLKNNQLIGANYYLIRDFYKLTDIEITYKKYKNIKSLVDDFEKGKVDFIFNNSLKQFKNETISVYDNVGVIVSPLSVDINANNLEGIKDKKILVLKNSSIQQILDDHNIEYQAFDSIKKMISHAKRNNILALDQYEFMYYQRKELKNYYVAFTFKINSYGYAINDQKTSDAFTEMFNFYISYANRNKIIKQGLLDYQNQKDFGFVKNIFLYVLSIIGVCLMVKELFSFIVKPSEKKMKIKKEDKIRYIDQLTSLKNRTYLNDKLPEWEKSNVYPQSIIIVDLNNIAYVNDNFGHEEGDTVICKAANILIQNQMVNSEIIRTSGNEFLIYLVGFDEKQIISYIKKLSKELKELPHDFGAAIGYSMIKDEIKTIDDAINESTLDMKTNKEEAKKS